MTTATETEEQRAREVLEAIRYLSPVEDAVRMVLPSEESRSHRTASSIRRQLKASGLNPTWNEIYDSLSFLCLRGYAQYDGYGWFRP